MEQRCVLKLLLVVTTNYSLDGEVASGAEVALLFGSAGVEAALLAGVALPLLWSGWLASSPQGNQCRYPW